MTAAARYNIDREKIGRLLAAGMKQTDIAAECGCTPKTVTFIKQEILGLRNPPNGMVGKQPWIDRDKARKLIESGMSNLQVAANLGCRPNTISALKRELGFEVKSFKKGFGRRAMAEKKRQGYASENNPGAIRLRRQSRASDADRPLRTKGHGSADFLFTSKRRVRTAQAALPLIESGREPVPYHTLGANQCRWIVGPYALGRADIAPACGCKAEEGSPWCAGHRAVAVSVNKVADQDELNRLARAADINTRAA